MHPAPPPVSPGSSIPYVSTGHRRSQYNGLLPVPLHDGKGVGGQNQPYARIGTAWVAAYQISVPDYA
eukprot:1476568-Rhodomonas_salina.1